MLIPFLDEDMDVEDFGNWNPESIPLLQRTIDQARSLGVKRTISWMAGEFFFVKLEKKIAFREIEYFQEHIPCKSFQKMIKNKKTNLGIGVENSKCLC